MAGGRLYEVGAAVGQAGSCCSTANLGLVRQRSCCDDESLPAEHGGLLSRQPQHSGPMHPKTHPPHLPQVYGIWPFIVDTIWWGILGS